MISRIRDLFRGITAKRSSHWPAVRKKYLKKNPKCQACSTSKRLEVHHVKPFYLNPELELDEDNFITFCRRCHKLIGHLDDWKNANTLARPTSAFMFRTFEVNKK